VATAPFPAVRKPEPGALRDFMVAAQPNGSKSGVSRAAAVTCDSPGVLPSSAGYRHDPPEPAG
jgi:hypothetical protein